MTGLDNQGDLSVLSLMKVMMWRKLSKANIIETSTSVLERT